MSREIRTRVAGVTFKNSNGSRRQDIIQLFVCASCPLALVREPDNPYDRNAIAVYYKLDKEDILYITIREFWEIHPDSQIGYLPREVAAEVAPLMDKGYEVKCTAIERTGDPEVEGSLGVSIKLAIRTPEEVERQLQFTRSYLKTRGFYPSEKKPRYSIFIVGTFVLIGIIYCLIKQPEDWLFNFIIFIPIILITELALNLALNPDD